MQARLQPGLLPPVRPLPGGENRAVLPAEREDHFQRGGPPLRQGSLPAQRPATGGRIPLCSTDWPLAVRFGATEVGTLEPYREERGVAFHDLSGAAAQGQVLLTVDDGGSPSSYSAVRVHTPGRGPQVLPLGSRHLDIEDVTALPGGDFVLTTSLAGEDPDQHKTTRLRLDATAGRIMEEQSVDLRGALFDALGRRFGAAWRAEIEARPEKAGGLNVEGLACEPGSDRLLFGLRSPLAGERFGPASLGPGYGLDRGLALVARVSEPFGAAPEVELTTLDLGGHGVRGMEWVPRLQGYVLIGGPVEKASGYSLWLWRPERSLARLDLAGFSELRRPESVLELRDGGRDYLVIISEQSGEECAGAPFNFLRVEMQAAGLER